jgi:hypothetical protein
VPTIQVDDKGELEKDSIPNTHTHSVLALVVNVVNGKSVTPDIKEAEIKATITVILGGTT